jgi:predicted HAD superfamily Cof-like phosphohydrolase
MIDYLSMVKEFHDKYGHYTSNKINSDLPTKILILREKLITEEAEEFKKASYDMYDGIDKEYTAVDIVNIADALADLLYVTFGAALAYGIPIDKVFAEVHRSNMTKSMNKDEKSIPGKTIKGPDYEPPYLKSILLYPL